MGASQKTGIFDPYSEVFIDDPFPMYSALRSEDPVHWFEPLHAWVISRYEDCRSVLINPAIFASDPALVNHPQANKPADRPPRLQDMDPPRNIPERSVARAALRLAEESGIEEEVTPHAVSLLRTARNRPEWDLISDVISPLTLRTIANVMGVPEPTRTSFDAWANDLATRMDSGLHPEIPGKTRESARRTRELLAQWCAEPATEGLVKYLRQHTTFNTQGLTSTIQLMSFSLYITLGATLGNSILTLLSRPGTLHGLATSRPADIDCGFDELIRFAGPVQATTRTCVTATVLSGVRMRRGDDVIVLFASANRDEEQFPDAARLVLDRNPNLHFGFGWGPHVCLGSDLAKRIFRAFLRAIDSTTPALRLAAAPRRRPIATLRSLATLPVTTLR